MGLAIVEMIMRVEEEFSITIEDEEASALEKVGQLHACVLSKLGCVETKIGDDERERVWQKLKLILVDELAVDPDEITPNAQFVRDLRLD